MKTAVGIGLILADSPGNTVKQFTKELYKRALQKSGVQKIGGIKVEVHRFRLLQDFLALKLAEANLSGEGKKLV